MERAIPSNEATPNRRVGQIRAVALHAALSAGFCLWPADYGAALRIDQAGDVLIAGSSYGGRNLDFYLASYAREDGTLRWEMRYHGAFNRDNYVSFSNGLATGPDGMIAMSGTTSGYDLATLVFQENVHRRHRR